jgi:Uma2 family endonuclease
LLKQRKKNYTPEEYLELELLSDLRNEYRDEEIIPMTGGTPDHNDIASNLIVSLKLALKNKPYRAFITDQRLWISDYPSGTLRDRNLYTYPDVMVVEKPLVLQAGRTDTIVNPIRALLRKF